MFRLLVTRIFVRHICLYIFFFVLKGCAGREDVRLPGSGDTAELEEGQHRVRGRLRGGRMPRLQAWLDPGVHVRLVEK